MVVVDMEDREDVVMVDRVVYGEGGYGGDGGYGDGG